VFLYIGIAHIVHEACSYSVASSVMEHVLAVHSVIWYRPHGAEHSLHLHSSLGSWNLASLQNFVECFWPAINSEFIRFCAYRY